MRDALPGGKLHERFYLYLDAFIEYNATLLDRQGKQIPYIFHPFHEHTRDGRFVHESLSKNMSASDGIGANGVTAMMRSACAIDYTDLPNGTALDLVLHSSAVTGSDGLAAMEGFVDAFMQMGGFALQINVLDPAVLKKAQQDPEKYKNLQVRICGWNVRFVDLKKHEQDEFIRWSSQR